MIFERTKELSEILSHINSAAPYRFFFITGPGGSGKTTLLRMVEDNSSGKQVLYVDCRNCTNDESGFVKMLAAAAGITGDPGRVWNKSNYSENTVLLVDTFKMMGPYVIKLLNLLSNLAEIIPVIVAMRTLPAIEFNHIRIQIEPFDQRTVTQYIKNAGLPVELAGPAYQFTGGNPLLLNLYTTAVARNNGRLNFDQTTVKSDFVSFIMPEVTCHEVLELLEAASVVHSFSPELLEHICSRPIEKAEIKELTNLSFVNSSTKNWQMHDVVSHALRDFLKKHSPKRYYTYKRKAMEFYYIQEEQAPEQRDIIFLGRLYLCEDDFAREILFGSKNDMGKFQITSYKQEDDPEILMKIWLDGLSSFGVRLKSTDEGLEDTRKLYDCAYPFIRMLKDKNGRILGYHTTVPVCSQTFDYFCNSPASRAYMNSLSKKELQRLGRVDVQNADTFFIRHFVPLDLYNPEIRGLLLRDIGNRCFRTGVKIVTTVPDAMMVSLVEGIGFRKVSGVYDMIFEQSTPVYELDFSQLSMQLWYEWLMFGRTLPFWLNLLFTYSEEAWQETVDKVLDNMSDSVFFAHHPLTPLAEEKTAGIPEGCQFRDNVLKNYIGQKISQLKSEAENKSDREMGILLEVTFQKALSREEAAEFLFLPQTTYFRRLKQARKLIAEIIYKDAVELAERKYTGLN